MLGDLEQINEETKLFACRKVLPQALYQKILGVMNDSLLLVVGPGFTKRVQKMTDHREEFKNTKGQNNDQDLKHYNNEVEQINYDELHSDWGRARGEVANGQSEGLSIILLQYIYLLQVCTCLA